MQNALFVLETGYARISLNWGQRNLTVAYLRPGGVFVTHSRARVEALEPRDIRRWPVRDLLRVMVQEPDFSVAALREIGGCSSVPSM